MKGKHDLLHPSSPPHPIRVTVRHSSAFLPLLRLFSNALRSYEKRKLFNRVHNPFKSCPTSLSCLLFCNFCNPHKTTGHGNDSQPTFSSYFPIPLVSGALPLERLPPHSRCIQVPVEMSHFQRGSSWTILSKIATLSQSPLIPHTAWFSITELYTAWRYIKYLIFKCLFPPLGYNFHEGSNFVSLFHSVTPIASMGML